MLLKCYFMLLFDDSEHKFVKDSYPRRVVELCVELSVE